MTREQKALIYFILLAHRFDLAQVFKYSMELTEHELTAYIRKYGKHDGDNI
jgi:hypothetical protein